MDSSITLPPAVGVICLAELRGASGERLSAFLRATGAAVSDEVFQHLEPPSCLIVLVPWSAPEQALSWLGWLARAQHVLWVRDHAVGEQVEDDPELVQVVEEGWRELDQRLCNVRGRYDWREGQTDELMVVLDHGLNLGDRRWPPEAAQSPTWPSGPWKPVPIRWNRRELASRLCVSAQGVGLASQGRVHSLLDHTPVPEWDSAHWSLLSHDQRWKLEWERGGTDRMIEAATGRIVAEHQALMPPIGFDPIHPVVVTWGEWHYHREATLTRLGPWVRDWPCGHVRKGFCGLRNFPESVLITPDRSLALSVFDYDTVISSQVPVRWRRAGGILVADWPPDPGEDPLRAALFCCSPEEEIHRGGPMDPDHHAPEDCRVKPPVVLAGTDAASRYAVDLNERTYRVRRDRTELLSDGGAGFAVYDADHRQVRSGRGRLLGGSFGIATVLDAGRLWREDLSTGARLVLGAEPEEITFSLAVPGTHNVLLGSGAGDDRQIRLA